VHHNFDDSDSGYDMEMDARAKANRGRIILLGDGSEVLTDSDDTEMFDHSEEDKDLDSQVHKNETSQGEAGKKESPPVKLDAIPENPTSPPVSDEVLPATSLKDSPPKPSDESNSK
jgi:protein phosphatase 2C family protein 2/3